MGGGLPFLRYYSRRVLGSPNVELRQTQRLLKRPGSDVIDLSLGAPPLSPELASTWSFEAQALSGYPPVGGLAELRDAVSEKLRRDNDLAIDPEHQLLICNGVSQGIGLMLDTFVDRGERVAIFDPSFFLYRLAAMNREARLVSVPTWLESGTTKFRERDLARALRGSRLLFLNTPANPTGGILTAESLQRIAWWCRRFDVLIFSDEVYEYFIHDGVHVSIAGFADARARTITANGFSKSDGMAGLRVGYLAGERHLIEPITVSFLAGAPFVSLAAQHMAVHALAQPPKTRILQRVLYAARAKMVSDRLQGSGLVHERPGGAFYAWVPTTALGCRGRHFAEELLEEQQVLVMSGESCGTSGGDYIRVSFAGPEEDVRNGLDRIAAFVAGRSRQRVKIDRQASRAA